MKGVEPRQTATELQVVFMSLVEDKKLKKKENRK